MAASAAEAVVSKVVKVPGAPSRAILNALRQKGRLTRPQLYELTPRELIPTTTRLREILQWLVKQKRVKPFLPTGQIYGKDHFAYKLNPTRRGVNFPELFGKKAQKRHLEHRMQQDTTGTLRQLVETTPEPDNAEILRLKKKIADARKML